MCNDLHFIVILKCKILCYQKTKPALIVRKVKNFIKKTWWRVVMLLTLQPRKRVDKEMINRTKDDRTTYFDLRCKTEDGREFIVEMQKAWQEFFLDRIIYYLSQSISPQGYKGTDESGTKWNYKL